MRGRVITFGSVFSVILLILVYFPSVVSCLTSENLIRETITELKIDKKVSILGNRAYKGPILDVLELILCSIILVIAFYYTLIDMGIWFPGWTFFFIFLMISSSNDYWFPGFYIFNSIKATLEQLKEGFWLPGLTLYFFIFGIIGAILQDLMTPGFYG